LNTQDFCHFGLGFPQIFVIFEKSPPVFTAGSQILPMKHAAASQIVSLYVYTAESQNNYIYLTATSCSRKSNLSATTCSKKSRFNAGMQQKIEFLYCDSPPHIAMLSQILALQNAEKSNIARVYRAESQIMPVYIEQRVRSCP
jgi:hypothetical protein